MNKPKNYVLKDLVKALRFIKKTDKKVLGKLYSLNLHPKLNKILRLFTRMGDGYIWAIPLIYMFSFKEMSLVIQSIKTTTVASAITLVIYLLIKNKVKRPRPYMAFDHVVAQVEPLDKYSFPSGHTMNNLTPGIVLGYYFPEMAFFTVGFPLMWGFLRIYFGVHYLSDVLGGILLSLICVGLAQFVVALIPAFNF